MSRNVAFCSGLHVLFTTFTLFRVMNDALLITHKYVERWLKSRIIVLFSCNNNFIIFDNFMRRKKKSLKLEKWIPQVAKKNEIFKKS